MYRHIKCYAIISEIGCQNVFYHNKSKVTAKMVCWQLMDILIYIKLCLVNIFLKFLNITKNLCAHTDNYNFSDCAQSLESVY